MNTGIQDAWNLGWKVALVIRRLASEDLLDSYESERWPVGYALLGHTDRVFSVFTRAISAGRVVSWVRDTLVARLLPRLFASKSLRSIACVFVSELRIRYRQSPAITEGQPRLRRGPRAGASHPDARVTLDGQVTSLQRAVIGPHLALLLCGDTERWDGPALARLDARYRGLVKVRRLANRTHPKTVQADARVLAMLGARGAAQYLVRPDGYIAFRCGGTNLDSLLR
jgi:FAD binding domain